MDARRLRCGRGQEQRGKDGAGDTETSLAGEREGHVEDAGYEAEPEGSAGG